MAHRMPKMKAIYTVNSILESYLRFCLSTTMLLFYHSKPLLALRDSKCSFGRNQKNHLNVEIMFHFRGEMRFDQLKNLSNATISSRISHILNPCRHL